jgi:hypothetical protein
MNTLYTIYLYYHFYVFMHTLFGILVLYLLKLSVCKGPFHSGKFSAERKFCKMWLADTNFPSEKNFEVENFQLLTMIFSENFLSVEIFLERKWALKGSCIYIQFESIFYELNRWLKNAATQPMRIMLSEWKVILKFELHLFISLLGDCQFFQWLVTTIDVIMRPQCMVVNIQYDHWSTTGGCE